MNVPVAAVTVGVVAFIRYHPLGSASILPEYPKEDVPTTQLSRSKFIYPELIPADARSCT